MDMANGLEAEQRCLLIYTKRSIVITQLHKHDCSIKKQNVELKPKYSISRQKFRFSTVPTLPKIDRGPLPSFFFI